MNFSSVELTGLDGFPRAFPDFSVKLLEVAKIIIANHFGKTSFF